ncbi:MAG TPA: ROK family transcriptional regulator [Thermoleophilia bacterium]|nr:ROK family transcriptional regulator [Thermoleophilia bacterium]
MLELLRRHGGSSRAEIARLSGLSKPTVSLALARLVDAGLAHATGRTSGGKGPSAQLFELNPGSGWVVGIDVGRRFVRAAVADITGGLAVRRDERARARSSRALVAQIGAIGHRVAADAGIAWDSVTAATVGSPGVLVPASGQLERAANLPGWGSAGVADAIRQQLGTTVSFENDVNLAALGERARGAGREVGNFVLLWVGTGVGLGIVIDGELYRGAGGAAGEIAYLPIGEGDPHDRAMWRRGQLEEAAAASGVEAHARTLGVAPPHTAKAVFAAARRGDDLAREVVAAEARRLALAIAVVAPVLDPELVILGGGIARGNADLLLDPLRRELRALSPFAPRLAVSELGEEAVLEGAVATALATAQDRLFSRDPDGRARNPLPQAELAVSSYGLTGPAPRPVAPAGLTATPAGSHRS